MLLRYKIHPWQPFVSTLILFSCSMLIAEDPLGRNAIEQRLSTSAKYLASDGLEGRGINTTGIDKAADYLAKQFSEAGLDTKQYQGTAFHTFQTGSRFGLGPDNALTIAPPSGDPQNLRVKVDYTPVSLSGSGKVDLPLAFVGYGITAPDLKYDDYEDIDIRGHAVIVLRNEPRKHDKDSPFDGEHQSDFGTASHKVSNAIRHGAAAVILVTDQASLVEPKPGDTSGADRLVDFNIKSTAGNRQIPVIHCRRSVVEPLFAAAKTDLATLELEIDTSLHPQSRLLEGSRVKGEVSVMRQGKELKNVVAVLNGSGPLAEETIVLGAHYDHLGYGDSGSLSFTFRKEIHNGADDNASGTATLLEVARQLAWRHTSQPLARRVVFIAFSAEESGLIGSERYVRDPLVPLSQTVAMLNMDMVGRLRGEKLTVYGTGTAHEFDPLIVRLSGKHGFALVKKPGGQGPSDHASFYQRQIPVLHFFTGLHREYHRPEDDADLLNIQGMARISQMVTEAVEELASAAKRPTYRKVSGGDDLDGMWEALMGTEASRTPAKVPVQSGERRPYLGLGLRKSKPDSMVAGGLVDNVTPDSPADLAGLRDGDVIHKLGTTVIKTSDDLLGVMKQVKIGEKVPLQVRRNGVDLELEVTVGSK